MVAKITIETLMRNVEYKIKPGADNCPGYGIYRSDTENYSISGLIILPINKIVFEVFSLIMKPKGRSQINRG